MRTLRHRVTGTHCLAFCVAVLILALAGTMAPAAVTATGDVIPADNPFPTTPGGPNPDEGLPLNGNAIAIFEPITRQTFFEGRHIEGPDPSMLTDDTNLNENIFVGQSSFGTLLITAETSLRYMNLVIGDIGETAGGQGGDMKTGTGVVRINGFGALYNNDFNILPAGLPMGFMSAVPRASEGSMDGLDGAEEGFDLYVGRAGTGTLEITAGGRAEIHDAIFVGDMPGSVGNLIVDGIDSFLGSGGNLESTGITEFHQTIIGRLGSGFMTISNGGTVLSDVIQSGATQFDTIGVVIGSEPQRGQNDEIEPGGRGVVNVIGPYSRWIVGGSMQVGGFQEGPVGDDSLFGTGLEYNSEAGRGTLRVQAGGLVHIRPAIDADVEDDELRLLIGRFGRVELAGGLIQMGHPGTLEDNVQVLNDGIIVGGGRIETGIFRNRHLGEIRIGPAEKLIIDSGSEFRNDAPAEPPLANWGVIEVLGTSDQPAELEIERAPATDMDPIQRFRNLRIPRPMGAPPSDFFGGLISAQESILRFRSGLENEGMLAFTKGSNYITGDVFNLAAPMPQDDGIINVLGEDVRAIFENDLFNGGVLNVQGGAVVEVLARHSFEYRRHGYRSESHEPDTVFDWRGRRN
jgi:hypothetical protein